MHRCAPPWPLLGWTGLVPMTVRTGPVTVLNHQVSWVLPVVGLALISSVVPYVAGIGAARRLGAKLASFAGLAEVLFAIAVRLAAARPAADRDADRRRGVHPGRRGPGPAR